MKAMNVSTLGYQMLASPERKRLLLLSLLLGGFGGMLFVVVTQSVSVDVGEWLIADDGPVQLLTYAVLLAAAATAAGLALRHPAERLTLGLATFMLVIYAAREADLNKAEWLPKDFANSHLYTAVAVPLVTKVAFGLLMLTIVAAGVWLVVRVWPRVVADLKARKPWVSYSTLWLLVFTASQISDRSSWNRLFAGKAFEEILECVAAGFVVLAVCAFPRRAVSRQAEG